MTTHETPLIDIQLTQPVQHNWLKKGAAAVAAGAIGLAALGIALTRHSAGAEVAGDVTTSCTALPFEDSVDTISDPATAYQPAVRQSQPTSGGATAPGTIRTLPAPTAPSATAERCLAQNTVFVKVTSSLQGQPQEFDCTGSLIERLDASGNAVSPLVYDGVKLAAGCGLLRSEAARSYPPNRLPQAAIQNIQIFTGDTAATAITTPVKRVILPADNTGQQEEAVLSFTEDTNQALADIKQVGQLNFGDTVTISSFLPDATNPNVTVQRIENQGVYFGDQDLSVITPLDIERETLHLFAVAPNSLGQICARQCYGSESLVAGGTSAGVLVSEVDIKQTASTNADSAAATKQYFEQRYSIAFTPDQVAIYGFAQFPTTDKMTVFEPSFSAAS